MEVDIQKWIEFSNRTTWKWLPINECNMLDYKKCIFTFYISTHTFSLKIKLRLTDRQRPGAGNLNHWHCGHSAKCSCQCSSSSGAWAMASHHQHDRSCPGIIYRVSKKSANIQKYGKTFSSFDKLCPVLFLLKLGWNGSTF